MASEDVEASGSSRFGGIFDVVCFSRSMGRTGAPVSDSGCGLLAGQLTLVLIIRK